MTAPAEPTLGRDVVRDVLRSEGVTHIFGNPGTTELPLIEALAEADDLSYVLALQEASVVGMADGYAAATGRPAFVNLHTSAGLGNAMGNLTNAAANNTPLVVTAGQADTRHLLDEPMLSGDLCAIATPVCKSTHEVRSADEVGRVLRRAFLDAATEPMGPVFVSLPSDLLEAVTDAPPAPIPDRRRAGAARGAEELADELCRVPVGKLGIVVGDEAGRSGATQTIALLAEMLGAPVYSSPLHATSTFPPAHPLSRGPLAPAAARIADTLGGFTHVLALDAHPFRVYPYTPGAPLPADTRLFQISADASAVGRYASTTMGLCGDIAATVEQVLSHVAKRSPITGAVAAVAEATAAKDAELARFDERARAAYDALPAAPMAAVHAALAGMPADTPVVDEAITCSAYVRGFHRTGKPGRYYFAKGGGLGWGMPAAVGVSLGRNRSPVLAAIGDGSACYSPQALWSAARLGVPVVFCVFNNRQYRILRRNLETAGGPSARLDRYVGMDLDGPAVDFVSIAEGFGVAAQRVERPADVTAAVAAAFEAGGPALIEIPIDAT